MEIDLARARAFLESRRQGILATIKRDGRPQLSNVLFVLDPDDDRIKVLIVIDQLEQWLHRNPDLRDADLVRALRQCDGAGLQALLLVRDEFWMAVTRLARALEVRLVEGEGVLPALRDYYRKARGEHPDWEEYDAAMVRDQRLLLSISLDRAYGQLP